MKAAFEVIVLPVSDPEKSLRFYRDARTTEEMKGICMRNSRRSTRGLLAVASGAVVIAVGALTAGCGNNGGPEPSSTTTTTTTTTMTTPSSSAPVSPTEKGLSPTGGNLFTPDVKAPPAPTEPPGVHRNK
jgi:hypothetical protein